ncbi:MAG: hypothetical protein HOL04_12605 [Gammaproteobacteria bacterium]|nr:hypothetical protein [Gammaproteobacteria bacterium]MBT4606661.1 hypothetical protein [Thiotrichales bacterium]MBT3968028.1 hypothetical protein [Gammaproteobacteria bacterium]MBT4079538.1 hypothetical protein [Gammaproteobacteria bacterium]MBT4330635.1 hypothetical protein [Gammaproteobacteria bacterium]
MSRLMENRRILAVDDDASILEQYQQIFTDSAQEPNIAHNQLVNVLEEGLEKESTPKESTSIEKRLPYQLSCFQNGKEAVDAIAQQLPR